MRRNNLRSGISVSEVCVGTSPLGGNALTYGYDVDEPQAVSTIEALFATELNFLDTSNEYGGGESERRIGSVIKSGGMPDGFVVATKADPRGSDFSGLRVRQSFDESCERLGLDHIDVFYLHDPERFAFAEMTSTDGALRAMVELKEKGLVTLIGVAGGDVSEMSRYLETECFDVVLNHNRFTLLDRTADPLIDQAADSGVAFVNAAPYASGMLAPSLGRQPRYQYSVPDRNVIAATERLRALCESYSVDLAAVALQFSMRDPRITSTVVGVSHPDRVDQLMANAQAEIPDELWDRLPEPLAK